MRNARAIDIGIHEADFRARSSEPESDARGDRTFTNAAFAGTDSDDALDRHAKLALLERDARMFDNFHFDVFQRRIFLTQLSRELIASFVPKRSGVSCE